MAVGFAWAVFKCAGQRGEEVGGFEEEGFGALGYEAGGCSGWVCEDGWEGKRICGYW